MAAANYGEFKEFLTNFEDSNYYKYVMSLYTVYVSVRFFSADTTGRVLNKEIGNCAHLSRASKTVFHQFVHDRRAPSTFAFIENMTVGYAV